jgi:hypothetical protein
MLYDLQLSRRLCIIKSSQATSRVKWLNGEKTNVGFFTIQPFDADGSPRRFYDS